MAKRRAASLAGVPAVVAEATEELDRVLGPMRERMVQILETRAQDFVKPGEERLDPHFRHLRALLRRFDEVRHLVQAFLVQVQPGLAPSDGDAQVAMEELLAGMEALFGIELEARTSQARIAQSSAVLEYAGVKRERPRTMSFRVERFVADRFKQLGSQIRQERQNLSGYACSLSPEDLLNLLLALGETNVGLLARMGAPEARMIAGLAMAQTWGEQERESRLTREKACFAGG